MNFLQPSLAAYIAEPDATIPLPKLSTAFCRALVNMAKPLARLYCVRRSAVGRAVNALNADNDWGKVRFHTTTKFAVQAYMRDGDGIYMSYGAFARSDGASFVLMFCHELAHVWLSRLDGYDNLKTLDKAYRTTFAELPNAVDTSPIEYLAVCTCANILRAAADEACGTNKKYSDMLRGIADKETSKAATLRNIIVSLHIAAE